MLTNLDCKGSVLLFNSDDTYCQKCPLKAECESAVNKNKALLEQALSRPLFDEDGKFWVATARRHQRIRAKAAEIRESPVEHKVETKITTPVIPTTHVSPYEALQQDGLPKKVRAELERWMSRGIDPHDLTKGVNPFADKPGFVVAAMFTEVARADMRTKREIKAKFAALAEERTGKAWADASLQSNMNIVLGAFQACGYKLYKE